MERFPTLASALAEAPLDDVLKQWQGLGYYARARNLHRAAQVDRRPASDGVFPADFADILALPGIGRYTAGAVGSIALGLDVPIVDANVIRVLCRYFGLHGDPKSGAVQDTPLATGEELIPPGAGAYLQSGHDGIGRARLRVPPALRRLPRPRALRRVGDRRSTGCSARIRPAPRLHDTNRCLRHPRAPDGRRSPSCSFDAPRRSVGRPVRISRASPRPKAKASPMLPFAPPPKSSAWPSRRRKLTWSGNGPPRRHDAQDHPAGGRLSACQRRPGTTSIGLRRRAVGRSRRPDALRVVVAAGAAGGAGHGTRAAVDAVLRHPHPRAPRGYPGVRAVSRQETRPLPAKPTNKGIPMQRRRFSRRKTTLAFVAFSALACAAALRPVCAQAQTSAPLPYQNSALPLAQRVDDLVGRMTLEEKVSQMQTDAKAIDRLGIPAYYWWSESLHGDANAGIATVFPAGDRAGEYVGHRSALPGGNRRPRTRTGRKYNRDRQGPGKPHSFQGLTFFSPNINIFRDPRWGRGQETYGEDPYLTGRFAVAFITGLQGDDPQIPEGRGDRQALRGPQRTGTRATRFRRGRVAVRPARYLPARVRGRRARGACGVRDGRV